MKNIFITLILLLFSNITVSQNTIDEKVTGNWIVKRIVKSNKNPNLKEITDSFATVTFKFMNDHSFLMTSKSNSKLFKMMTNMTNGKKWITQDNSIIHIGSKSDNYNIMKIIYKEENNYITFTIYESDLVFVVEKQI